MFGPLMNVSATAAVDLKKGDAVIYDGSGDLILAGAGVEPLGFVYDSRKAGEPTRVISFGEGKARTVAGLTVRAGDWLEIAASGRVDAHSTGIRAARANNDITSANEDNLLAIFVCPTGEA